MKPAGSSPSCPVSAGTRKRPGGVFLGGKTIHQFMDDPMSQDMVPSKEEAVKWILSCFAAGRMSDAEQAARLLVKADGDDEVAVHLAQILHKRSAHGEALDVMQRVLEINSVHAVYHNDYGVMLAALGRWPEAEAAHRLSLVLDAPRSDARFNLALMLFRQKKTAEALKELDILETVSPDLADL